jgi:hypothetical protein
VAQLALHIRQDAKIKSRISVQVASYMSEALQGTVRKGGRIFFAHWVKSVDDVGVAIRLWIKAQLAHEYSGPKYEGSA